MTTGSVEITIELQATPDVLTHVARLTETVLAVDGVMTVRRSPTLFEGPAGDVTGAMERAVSGEHQALVPDDVEQPRGRGRRG